MVTTSSAIRWRGCGQPQVRGSTPCSNCDVTHTPAERSVHPDQGGDSHLDRFECLQWVDATRTSRNNRCLINFRLSVLQTTNKRLCSIQSDCHRPKIRSTILCHDQNIAKAHTLLEHLLGFWQKIKSEQEITVQGKNRGGFISKQLTIFN